MKQGILFFTQGFKTDRCRGDNFFLKKILPGNLRPVVEIPFPCGKPCRTVVEA